jgi:Leucine-rich repeat (LRR) protein
MYINLETLILDSNKITDFIYIPLNKLKKLILSNNDIKRVDLKESFKML